MLDRDVLCPSVTINGGTLILKKGAALLSGLQVPEGKVLADYLPEGTAFVKCSYDYSSNTVTVSDPQEFVSDVYTANKLAERMVIVSHTHDFSGSACPCGFNCDHSRTVLRVSAKTAARRYILQRLQLRMVHAHTLISLPMHGMRQSKTRAQH